MFGHKQQQTHRQQFINELGESAGALRRAAGHFALGTAERLTPTYDRARYAAGRGWESTRESLNPLYHQIRETAAQARAMRRMQSRQQAMHAGRPNGGGSRMRGFATLLAAGAVVGAAGAAVARRRRAQQAEWEEYDPLTGETRYYGAGSRYAEEGRRSPRERMTSGIANAADSLSSRAGRVADSLHDRSESMQGSGTGAQAQPGQNVPPGTTRPMTGPSGTGPGMPASGTSPVPGTPTARTMGDPALGFPEAP